MTSPRTVVLLWNRVSGIGGTETRMAEVAIELGRRGVRTVSLVPDARMETPFLALLRDTCSEVREASGFWRLRRELRLLNSPVIAFGLRASLRARLAAYGLMKPISLFDARNGLEFGRSKALWTIDRLSQWRIRSYLANSWSVAQQLQSAGIQGNRVTVLTSAIGAEWLTPNVAVKDPAHVVMVGNSRPEKEQWLGLAAIAHAQPPVNLTVYTDRAAELRHFAEGLKLPGTTTVTFVEGHRVTPADLASVAILLHPSRSESLPRVILEAMAQGVIPVATDTGDTRRIVGSAGWVVPVGDRPALTAALDEALARARTPGVTSPIEPATRGVGDYCDELIRVLS